MGMKELPKDLTKLVKLRVLDITSCMRLNCMPWGMGKLSCLQKLTMFVLVDTNLKTKRYVVDQLEDLKALENLKGRLDIQIKTLQNTEYDKVGNSGQGGYLCKQELSHLSIQFPEKARESKKVVEFEEALLEDLQPHHNLRRWDLGGYSGKRMPNWAREDNLVNFLPNLVRIKIARCDGLQNLGSLGRLHHLESLEVENLRDLGSIEDTTITTSSNGVGASELVSFFPSLKCLKLCNLPKLKGWWRDDEMVELFQLPSFLRLSSLYTRECPNLACIPLCPSLEELNIGKCNEKLQIVLNDTNSGDSKIRDVFASDVGSLKSILPKEGITFQCLELMSILGDMKVESLSEVSAVFQSCSSSLQSLEISTCLKLESLYGGGLEHLTALKKLRIHNLPNLINLSNADGMPWRCLHHNLRSLSLEGLPKIASLPKGMQYLTALQSLFISYSERLESLPESIRKLTSLKKLEILDCSPELTERCRNPNGEDWPNIRHIPHVVIDKIIFSDKQQSAATVSSVAIRSDFE